MKTPISPRGFRHNRKCLIPSLIRDNRPVTFYAKKIIYTLRVNEEISFTRASEKKVHIYTFLISVVSY